MRTPPFAGAAALAATTWMPIAHADPGDQARLYNFNNYMASHGYPGDPSPRPGVAPYPDLGFQVCAALRAGRSEGSQIGRLEGKAGRAEASLVVAGAHQFLCPARNTRRMVGGADNVGSAGKSAEFTASDR